VGGGVKVEQYSSFIRCCSGEIFSEPRIFLLLTIADSSPLGQSASGLIFYDDSRLKPLFHHFPYASGIKLLLGG
jgi:hypothetical protein